MSYQPPDPDNAGAPQRTDSGAPSGNGAPERNLPPIGAEEEADAAQEAIRRLEEELRRTPKSRLMERAVLRYRLGLAYQELPTGRRDMNLGRAVASLEESARLFNPSFRPIEHARAQNGLGAALRELGEPEKAADAFRTAAELMPLEINPGEHGASMNNLGLVLSSLGRTEEAVAAYEEALSAFSGSEFLQQRINVLLNWGQALAASTDPDTVRRGIGLYEDALELADPQELPYQWGLAHHSLGVAYTAVGEPAKAIEEFKQSLRVFSRHRWPFPYALTKNNLGLAYMQLGGETELRRAVASCEDALRVLDFRMHKEQWEQAYRNLELAEKGLEEVGSGGSRMEHFARMLGEEEGDPLLTPLRERLMEYTLMADPRGTEVLAELDQAILSLPRDQAQKVTSAWLNVLMEMPHEQFVQGVKARMLVHNSLDEAAKQEALAILDHTIQEELLAPQRVRVRDTLYELGYERPV